jgi:glycosyltransferase involved in cell wall biosynthesis
MEFDISVVICTRNRAASLHEALSCLAAADRTGLNVEIVIVNNGGTDSTPEVIRTFEDRLQMRSLFEPKQGVFGKSHALNRALDEGGLGEIIAVLDDDMTPHREWFQGVASLSARWPDKDLFTGRSYVVWPEDTPPEFVQCGVLQTWMYSIIDEGEEDRPIGNGRWFSGNHFWFRSRVLKSGLRFDDIWLTEPKFMLDMIELGYGAVAGPDAVTGHRIQKRLLMESVIRERACKVGSSNADVRLRPYRKSVKHARFLNQRPLLGRLFFCAKLVQSEIALLRARLHRDATQRFIATMIALEKVVYNRELLRTAAKMREYRIFGRSR